MNAYYPEQHYAESLLLDYDTSSLPKPRFLTNKKMVNENNYIISEIAYKYNSDGFLIEEIHYAGDSELLEVRDYDDRGNLITHTTYSNGCFLLKEIFEYSELDNEPVPEQINLL